MRSTISSLLRFVFRQTRLGHVFSASGPKSVFDTWELQRERKRFQREFYEYWKSLKIDALICPTMSTVINLTELHYLTILGILSSQDD